ncbi:MAG: sigma-70 family RNA polymerase sigma factor [Thermoleophilaceae bacterium]
MEATSLPRGRALALPRRVLATLDDERLVRHLRRGNVVAFEVIYDRHHRGILGYARHLLGSREEAEDAVQHTFASAYDALVGGDTEIKLKAWLYTIARNRCLSVLRARREQPAELGELSTAGLADEVQQRDDLRALLADLRELPEHQRAALVLAEVAGLGHADIAQVLECDVAKVKSLVFQARSGLIERRQARDTPCEDIREQLAVLTGGSLRRGPLRRHLKACPGCASYRDEVKRQRRMLALALPVIPTVGLKESALAAVGIGGGAAGVGGATAAGGGMAAAGGAALGSAGVGASGGLAGAAASLAAKAGLAKVAVAVVAGGAAVGGGTYAITTDAGAPATGGERPVAPASGNAPAAEGAAPQGGPPAVVPDMGEQRSERARERRSEQRREAARERRAARRRAAEGRRDEGRARGRDDARRPEGRPGGGEPGGSRRGAERRRAKPEPPARERGRSTPPRGRPERPDTPQRPAPQSSPRPAPDTAPAPDATPTPGPQGGGVRPETPRLPR